MKKIFILFLFFINTFLYSSELQNLLNEYENSSNESLQTINEKMGHVKVYSQNELKHMQYEKLSDILKELPVNNFGRSTLGSSTLSLSGTKAQTSGYFRLFINDHEVSFAHTNSPFITWYNIPIGLIDYIEVYYGEGSFTNGNETGVEFIRVYTKKGIKENGTMGKTTISNDSSNSQEFSYSTLLENGWSYILYFAKQNSFFEKTYNNQKIVDNVNQQYAFLDISNGKNEINIGYTNLNKTNFQGFSFDSVPDDGELLSDDFFISYKRYLTDDKLTKLSFSVDIQNRKYEEKDTGGINIPTHPINLSQNIKEYHEDAQFIKTNLLLSKTFKSENNNLFTAFNVKTKKLKLKNRTIVDNTNTTINVGPFNDYNETTTYSLMLQDDYKILDNLYLIGNLKFDKHINNGFMSDTTEALYRVGSIYLPTKNLGLKTFYTITHIPASFYNEEFAFVAQPKLKSQKYKYFTFEGTYLFEESKFTLEYFNVKIDDYIYYVAPGSVPLPGGMIFPGGFINVAHQISTDGFIFDYTYDIDRRNKLSFNYFFSSLSEVQSSYTRGGYIKYMGSYDKFTYFTSLIYRKGFEYQGLEVNNSYDLSLGTTYSFDKNTTLSIKANNILNKPTQSFLSDATNIGNPSLSLYDNFDRTLSVSLEWRF